jgi:glycosyltransferase involved in cell wall biosynthesis
MRARVTVAIPVLNRLELTRACLESLRHTREPFEAMIIDNGSTDGTAEFVRALRPPYPVRYECNPPGTPLRAALNRAWPLVATEAVCVIHNDTEMLDPLWLSRLLAALDAPDIGLAGLYGAKRLRRDGRYVGRTIVHCLAEGPTVRAPWEEVAVVDAVCLCLRINLLRSLGGFDAGDEFHGLDRELSFAVRERGLAAVVVHAPFVHRGGGTRAAGFATDPARERDDLTRRAAALDRFAAKWAKRLPSDVRPLGRRMMDWMSARAGHRRTVQHARAGAPEEPRR